MMARQKCVSGAYSGVCDATDYGPTYELVETKCDGLDNDCDGFSDSKPIVQLAGCRCGSVSAGSGVTTTRVSG